MPTDDLLPEAVHPKRAPAPRHWNAPIIGLYYVQCDNDHNTSRQPAAQVAQLGLVDQLPEKGPRRLTLP